MDSSSARFRSATDFPQTLQGLNPAQSQALYEEMRNCLIFTNRSRAQLIRRNQEHKDKAGLLKTDAQRLRGMIQQLTLEKAQISEQQRQVVSALEAEMQTMATHLDDLSFAFDGVDDMHNLEQVRLSVLATPQRFWRFIKAVAAVVMWWRSDRPDDRPPLPRQTGYSLQGMEKAVPDTEESRDRPQMHSDQASQNRSLLDR